MRVLHPASVSALAACLVVQTTGSVPEPRRTKTVLLWFADGGSPPREVKACRGRTPPPFSVEGQVPVQVYWGRVAKILERWYRPFPIRFVTDESTPADATIVVTSSGEWCGVADVVAGSSGAYCDSVPPEKAVAVVFHCGREAHRCAAVIAHEHGHLMGLEHASDIRDVMSGSYSASIDGFLPSASSVVNSRCGRSQQSSLELLLTRLGAR